MPHAPTTVNSAKMQTKRSAWTPLNHAPSNSQLFEERRALLAKWFSLWTDSQRGTVLEDLMHSCSLNQLLLLGLALRRQLPLLAADFTCTLPRALSLYVFSFLDPRSLCRCAQVSWRWKAIVELDQLWMVKCVRRGWYLDSSPTQSEKALWKRHYIDTVAQLRSASAQMYWRQMCTPTPTAVSPQEELRLEDALLEETRRTDSSHGPTPKPKRTSRSPLRPWRDADRKPRDIVRFNYLDNPHAGAGAEASSGKLQRSASHRHSSASAAVHSSKHKPPTEARHKLRKAKSLMFLSSNSRPSPPPSPPPPDPPPVPSEPRFLRSVESVQRLLRQSRFNAAVRPGPVRSSAPRQSGEGLRTARGSHRSAPNVPFLEFILQSESRKQRSATPPSGR